MPMAAGPVDRAAAPVAVPVQQQPMTPPPPSVVVATAAAAADGFAKDAILAWFRGEFAAANAIIDALCAHLAQLGAATGEYEAAFAAIHRRRLNWIPVLQMQKYHSIADVAVELRRVTERVAGGGEKKCGGDRHSLQEEEEAVAVKEACFDGEKKEEKEEVDEKVKECVEEIGGGIVVVDDGGDVVHDEEEDSPNSEITDSGSHEVRPNSEDIDICSNHEECNERPNQIKLTKGFTAKEQMKGHTASLKLYEDVFTDSELSKLTDFVNELQVAGQNGELSGETYILFNKQMKGNRRELIQFGVPIFGHIKDEAADQKSSNIEPIPALLQGVIDHLVQWQLIPEYKKPNGCIIHFFDQEEYSQPFLKPPHLEQPISTLVLSESTMAFGRVLVSDNEGNYRGSLMLSLKEGSILVMRGNSADMAGHAMCPSSNKRISITFFRVRPESTQVQSPPTSPMAGAMTLWQPAIPSPYPIPNGAPNGYETIEAIPNWGVVRTPVVMLAPVRPLVLSPKRMPRGGTGVFLPWAVGSRKPAKHLPPRAQKGRLLALNAPVETHAADSAAEKVINVEGK
ncbi:hypothetical protein Tsubulata_023842 [Turnera subulata]|uniref:Fe2OG dioxygenase domain-containing protein n=1 Tax=Turnera subulata TaxID=218843 RepID=A0A9Q0G661_9ROSI|nr:hypothetical protein Tsubulata_023842 [Turnera subulata]